MCRAPSTSTAGDQEGGLLPAVHQKRLALLHGGGLSAPGAEAQNLRTEVNAQVTRVLFEAPAPWVGICSTARPFTPRATARCC